MCGWLLNLTLILAAPLLIPAHWPATPTMVDTESLGLRMNSWQLSVPEGELKAWMQRHNGSQLRPRCTRISSPQDPHWHCLQKNTLFSLLRLEDGDWWVQSERLDAPDMHRSKVEQDFLRPLQVELLSAYRTPIETVLLLSSAQPLFIVERQFRQRQTQLHGVELMYQGDEQGFVSQWRTRGITYSLSAWREADGHLRLTYTQAVEP